MANFWIDRLVANAIADAMPGQKALLDGVVTPGFTGEATDVLNRRGGRCRMMVNPYLTIEGSALMDMAPRYRYVRGGHLVQPNYTYLLDFGDPDIKIYGDLTIQMKRNLLLAQCVGCTSNSNTITLARDGMIIGNGVGQQSRIEAAELVIKRAIGAGHGIFKWFGKLLRCLGVNYTKNALKGAAAYSDSFFSHIDAVEALIRAGVEVIFSTSGSKCDEAVQELCAKHGVTLVQLPDKKARGFFGH